MAKIIYFTAAPLPTGPEKTAIQTITGLLNGNTMVIRVAGAGNYAGGEPEAADYVAGTLVAPYDDAEEYPVFSLTAPPAPPVGTTQKVITSGVEFAGPDKTGTYVNGWTPTIVAGAVTVMLAS